MNLRERIAELNPEAMFLDGPAGNPGLFDAALIGVVERFGLNPLPLYDRAKLLALFEAQGMTEDVALDWYDYNVIGAWVGEGTPAFAVLGELD